MTATITEPQIQNSDEQVGLLVQEHMGWATSIAKSVARAWNLDWQLDGIDGGAYEGLVFCAKRFDHSIGVPFRAYARRRIHEAATEEARKSKSWQRGVGSASEEEQIAREISFTIFKIFPELREGLLPASEDSDPDAMRSSVRQLLASASLISAFMSGEASSPESAVQYKRMLSVVSELDVVHQEILYNLYWKGSSMRSLATEWEIDELAIVREHREILLYVSSRLDGSKKKQAEKPKVRRGLRTVQQKLRKDKTPAPFAQFATIGLLLAWPTILELLQRNLW